MAKILLVEDDKSLREIYGVRLLAEGYDIVSAGDGEEALAMAIKERPQLIVSDVMMPKISGFDMLDILRSTTETRDIKVIMMTALSSEDQRLRGEQLGADRYLVKSQVGIEDVVRTVHEVLGDSPITLPQTSAFAPAAPSALPRPDPTAVPQRPMGPQTPIQPNQAVQPQQPVATAPAPVQAPTVAPQQPMQALAVPQSSLPQPTAPFSSPRPAGLADRVIQPIERPDEDQGEALGSLMDKELGRADEPVAPQMPVAPTPPPIPSPPPAPQMPAPAPTPLPPAPTGPVEEHGISFEETPRPTA